MEQHLLLIILIGGKYNLPIIEQFIHSTFSFVSSDPQKYKGYDREGKHKSSNEPVPDSNRCRLCVRGKRK